MVSEFQKEQEDKKKVIENCTEQDALKQLDDWIYLNAKVFEDDRMSHLSDVYQVECAYRLAILEKLKEIVGSGAGTSGSNTSNCETCGNAYFVKSSKSRFCSTACRVKNHREKQL